MPKIEIKSTINSAQYKRGIKEMQTKNKKFGDSTKGIQAKLKGAFAVTAVVALGAALAKGALKLINFGSKLSDMATQADVSVESFQRLSGAVRDAGGSPDALVSSLIKVKAAQGDVLGGNTEFLQSFNLLGISIDDLAEMNTEQLFNKIAQGVTKSGNAALQFNAALEILGKRGGGKLIEAINTIGNATDELGNNLEIMSNRNAQTLDIMADRWERFKNNLVTVLAVIASGFFGGRVEDELNKRLNAQKRQADQARKGREFQKDELKRAKEAAKAEKEKTKAKKEAVAQAQKEKTIRDGLKNIQESVKIEIDTDRFREIGGLAGGMLSESLQIERRNLTIQQKQEDFLKKIEENTREGGGLL